MASENSAFFSSNRKTKKCPKLIHFIWLGGHLPEKYVQNIIDYAKKSADSGYKVILWVDQFFISDAESRVAYFLKHAGKDQKDLGNLYIARFDSMLRNTNSKFYNNYIDIEVALKLISLFSQTKHPRQSANYAACSDLLRYLILYRYGGLYVDTDNPITSCKDKFGDIELPADVGFKLMLRSQFEFVTNNCIIAATKSNPFIAEMICEVMEKIGKKPGLVEKITSRDNKTRYDSTLNFAGPLHLRSKFDDFQYKKNKGRKFFHDCGFEQVDLTEYKINSSITIRDGNESTWQRFSK